MFLNIEAKPQCLYATLGGVFSLAEAEKLFLQILEAVSQHEFVARSTAELIARTGVRVPRFAYVLLAPVLDPDRLGETVAVNRGMQVKAFDDLEAALQWLQARR